MKNRTIVSLEKYYLGYGKPVNQKTLNFNMPKSVDNSLTFINWVVPENNSDYYINFTRSVEEEDDLIFDPNLVDNLENPTEEELMYLGIVYGSETVDTYNYMLKVYRRFYDT